METINMGKANIISLEWDTTIKKLPENGELLIDQQGNYFKVMSIKDKQVRLLQI